MKEVAFQFSCRCTHTLRSLTAAAPERVWWLYAMPFITVVPIVIAVAFATWMVKAGVSIAMG